MSSKGYLSGTENGFELYPYVHEFSHQASTRPSSAVLLSPKHPPTTPGFKKPNTLQLGYGDFTQLATTAPGQYDAVVTLYLIDTAENAMKYLLMLSARFCDPAAFGSTLAPSNGVYCTTG